MAARDTANPAQDRGGEGFQAWEKSHKVVHLAKDDRIEHAGDTRHSCTRGKSDGDRSDRH